MLENDLFLTPSVESRRAYLYGVSAGAILGRFSDALPSRYVGTVLLIGCQPGNTGRGPETLVLYRTRPIWSVR